MIKFRLHRGTLEESMKDFHTFDSVDEMKSFLYNYWKQVYDEMGHPVPFDISDIVVDDDYIGDDPRIGWKNVHTVSTLRWCSRRPGGVCAWIGE